MNNYYKIQFQLARSLMGLYLIYFWLPLYDHASFLFSKEGIFFDLPKLFGPSIFNYGISPELLILFFSGIGLFLVLGILPYLSLIISWVGFVSFVNFIPYVKWPSEGVIGWLLIFMLFFPQKFLWDKIDLKTKKINISPWLITIGLITLGFLYTISGINKLESPSWTSGLGIIYSLQNSFSNNNFLTVLTLASPVIIQKIIGWIFLLAELICLPAFFGPRIIKKYTWLALTLMHGGIFMLMNIWIVTVPMLIFHLLVFDWHWFKEEHEFGKKILQKLKLKKLTPYR